MKVSPPLAPPVARRGGVAALVPAMPPAPSRCRPRRLATRCRWYRSELPPVALILVAGLGLACLPPPLEVVLPTLPPVASAVPPVRRRRLRWNCRCKR